MTENTVSPVDAIWLNNDMAENLMVIECMVMLDGPLDRERFDRVVRERLIARFPVFSQRLTAPKIPGRRARWSDVPDFRLSDHIREVVLASPAGDQELQEYVGGFLSAPLPRNRPLWEMHLIEGGEGTVIYVRLHHALADGIALTRVLLSITDASADLEAGAESMDLDSAAAPGTDLPGEQQHRQTPPRLLPASAIARLGTSVRLVLQTLGVLRKLLFSRHPETLLSGKVGSAKKIVWSDPIPLARVKALSRATSTTVNDVLVAALAGALQRYQIESGTQATDLPTMIPVNLRPLDQPLPASLGNRFAVVLLQLPSGQSTPADRLAHTHRRMEAIKSSPEALVTFALIYAIGLTGRRLSRPLVSFFAGKASGVTTNVPGPREYRYLAGTRVNGLLGWVPGQRNQTLGTCIFTYAGSVRVGFKTDTAAIPDPGLILAAFHDELTKLFAMAEPPASGDPAAEQPPREVSAAAS